MISVVDVNNGEASSSSVRNPRKEVECVCVIKECPNVLSVLVLCKRFHLTYYFMQTVLHICTLYSTKAMASLFGDV